jgi:hypothetical protein
VAVPSEYSYGEIDVQIGQDASTTPPRPIRVPLRYALVDVARLAVAPLWSSSTSNISAFTSRAHTADAEEAWPKPPYAGLKLVCNGTFNLQSGPAGHVVGYAAGDADLDPRDASYWPTVARAGPRWFVGIDANTGQVSVGQGLSLPLPVPAPGDSEAWLKGRFRMLLHGRSGALRRQLRSRHVRRGHVHPGLQPLQRPCFLNPLSDGGLICRGFDRQHDRIVRLDERGRVARRTAEPFDLGIEDVRAEPGGERTWARMSIGGERHQVRVFDAELRELRRITAAEARVLHFDALALDPRGGVFVSGEAEWGRGFVAAIDAGGHVRYLARTRTRAVLQLAPRR